MFCATPCLTMTICFPLIHHSSICSYIYLREERILTDLYTMDNRNCRQQTLNLNILCSLSSIMLFPKINIKPPNDTSTCCSCSMTSWCESLVTQTEFVELSVIQIVHGSLILLHENPGSFRHPIKTI